MSAGIRSFMIRIAAGPTVTSIMQGMMKKNIGKIIFTLTFEAFSSASWRRRTLQIIRHACGARLPCWCRSGPPGATTATNLLESPAPASVMDRFSERFLPPQARADLGGRQARVHRTGRVWTMASCCVTLRNARSMVNPASAHTMMRSRASGRALRSIFLRPVDAPRQNVIREPESGHDSPTSDAEKAERRVSPGNEVRCASMTIPSGRHHQYQLEAVQDETRRSRRDTRRTVSFNWSVDAVNAAEAGSLCAIAVAILRTLRKSRNCPPSLSKARAPVRLRDPDFRKPGRRGRSAGSRTERPERLRQREKDGGNKSVPSIRPQCG